MFRLVRSLVGTTGIRYRSVPRIRNFTTRSFLLIDKPKDVEIIDNNVRSSDEGSAAQHTVLDITDEIEDKPTDFQTVYLDTMDVYQQLVELGFTEGQCDVILRLIKENLTVNLDKLQSKILTDMELENEAYLFEAAQSELKVETQTSRESNFRSLEMDKSGLERLLQVESDELNEYLIMSKSDSQVTINDQISENTLLQKKIKMEIQELNNKISTNINSDIKTEIESLRWHTTRSGLMAVLVLVLSVMGGASISKKINKEEEPTQVILRLVEPETIDHDEDDDEPQKEKEPELDPLDLELKK